MADGIKLELTGAKELAAFLAAAGKEPAIEAGRNGAMSAATRLRTYLRRAAPVGQKSVTREKNGWPRLRDVIRAKKGNRAAIAWAGLIGRSPYYYRTLDQGRKAFTRYGKPVKGSPQMSRFAWFNRTVEAHRTDVLQVMVKATRRELFKSLGRLKARTGAPITFTAPSE